MTTSNRKRIAYRQRANFEMNPAMDSVPHRYVARNGPRHDDWSLAEELCASLCVQGRRALDLYRTAQAVICVSNLAMDWESEEGEVNEGMGERLSILGRMVNSVVNEQRANVDSQ
jgi:hypothetical protein